MLDTIIYVLECLKKKLCPVVKLRKICLSDYCFVFSLGHATLHLAVSVGTSVGHIFESLADFALLPLPNRP